MTGTNINTKNERLVYLFIIFCLLAVVVWFYIDKQIIYDSQEVIERNYEITVDRINAEIKVNKAKYDSVLQKMKQDSIYYNSKITASQKQITRLKHDIQKIDFHNSTGTELDSITRILYPNR